MMTFTLFKTHAYAPDAVEKVVSTTMYLLLVKSNDSSDKTRTQRPPMNIVDPDLTVKVFVEPTCEIVPKKPLPLIFEIIAPISALVSSPSI
ncbi:hypothetical protein MCOL2_08836 [Listeria fleischmannii FSL S10-1203]|uniref:Uncharacterized protein n=1 Tax=Listeria fleischmannii FSL S10-1203 TaxID=1265822 RepID=W7DF28_9LIST|nr:hypothetical protein MCOL2_08836 [Listeria fleischmannii FSL S10-1203]